MTHVMEGEMTWDETTRGETTQGERESGRDDPLRIFLPYNLILDTVSI